MNYIILALGLEDTKPYEKSEGGKAEVSWNVGGRGNFGLLESHSSSSLMLSQSLLLSVVLGPAVCALLGILLEMRNIGLLSRSSIESESVNKTSR